MVVNTSEIISTLTKAGSFSNTTVSKAWKISGSDFLSQESVETRRHAMRLNDVNCLGNCYPLVAIDYNHCIMVELY